MGTCRQHKPFQTNIAGLRRVELQSLPVLPVFSLTYMSSQVSKPVAPDATHFSWCPDGEHVVTATCSPRLRVSNGFKIWHYTGSVLHKQNTAAGSELWEVCWQSFPEGSFPERAVKYQAAPSELGTTQAPPTQAYRPPALRHLPATPSAKLVRKALELVSSSSHRGLNQDYLS